MLPHSKPHLLEHVVRFIRDTRWAQLSKTVQHQTRRCLLDLLGSLLAGAVTPAAQIMADVARTQFAGDEATILLYGDRVSASGAALANGFSGNALDVDDGYRLIKGHPGACVLPALLAAAETTPDCRGTDLLSALAVGYEIGIRAGLIRHATSSTYHSSGSWGALAGAAAAGRLLSLNDAQILQALGAAEYHAPIAPMMKGIARPSMGKDSIGWGALVSIMSVWMARRGFTGITPLFSESPENEWILELGHNWRMLDLYFKPYTACRWAQPAIDGALLIQRQHHLDVEDMQAIRIRAFQAACALSCRPPANTEEAQYNLAYPVAAALVDGAVGPAQVLPPRIFDAAVLKILDRISTEVEDAFEAVFPAQTLTEVVIETGSGQKLSSGPVAPRWEPPDTLPTDAELQTKFLALTTPVLGSAAARKLSECIRQLDDSNTITELITLCCPQRTTLCQKQHKVIEELKTAPASDSATGI